MLLPLFTISLSIALSMGQSQGECRSNITFYKIMTSRATKKVPFGTKNCLKLNGCIRSKLVSNNVSTTHEICDCCPGYDGDCGDCRPICELRCNHGFCESPDSCQCLTGWTGLACTEPICNPPCLNLGKCAEPGVCSCGECFIGPRCETNVTACAEIFITEFSISILPIVIGVPAFAILVVVLVAVCCIRRARKNLNKETKLALAMLNRVPAQQLPQQSFTPIRATKQMNNRIPDEYCNEYTSEYSEYADRTSGEYGGCTYGGAEVEYLCELADKAMKSKVISPNRLEECEELHRGIWFTVTLCSLKGRRQDVVWKKVRVDLFDEAAFRDMQEKIRIYGLLPKHKNIVKFFGKAGSRESGNMGMVLEYCNEGTLKDWLSQFCNANEAQLRKLQLQLLNFAGQVATGLQHLHSHNIIHRKVSARNTLLTSISGSVKVCKIIGLGSDSGGDLQRQTSKIPIKWLPPEAITRRDFHQATDYWSYGVCVWEIFSLGAEPFSAVSNEAVPDLLVRGERLSPPDLCPAELYKKLMMPCWDLDPINRPNFEKCIEIIRSLKVAGSQVNADLQQHFNNQIYG